MEKEWNYTFYDSLNQSDSSTALINTDILMLKRLKNTEIMLFMSTKNNSVGLSHKDSRYKDTAYEITRFHDELY